MCRKTVFIVRSFLPVLAACAALFASCEQPVDLPPEEPVYTYYTVHFEANGGTYGEMEDSLLICGQAQTLPYCHFQWHGCSFAGWALSPDGEVVYTEMQKVIDLAAADETITLYAVWTLRPDAFMIKYDANGGGGTMASTVVNPAEYKTTYWPYKPRYGYAPENLPPNTYTNTCFVFAGWATEPEGEVRYADKYEVRDLFAKGETMTLYAVWKTLQCTIYYDASGGYGTMPFQGFAYDVAQDLRKNIFFRYGYTFAGWATSPKSTTVEYVDEQNIINLTTSMTLYAVWLDDQYYTYSIRYDANGGSGSMSGRYIIDRTYNLPSHDFILVGHAFAGWATSPDGPAVYADEESVTNVGAAGDSVTLYAVWDICPDAYFVKYDANGGDGAMSVSTFVFGEPYNLRTHNFTRAYYVFAGWATSPDGAVEYTNGQSVTNLGAAGETITLYAVWKAYTYTVVFDKNANNAAGTMDSQSFNYDEAQNLYPNGFTRAGYTFIGWADSVYGAVVYTDGQSVINLTTTANGTINLFAVWRNNYQVVYHANGGDGTMDDTHFVSGVAQNLRFNTFTRAGYTFMGWARSEDGAVVYANGQSVNNLIGTANGTIHLYAKWSAGAYTIAYNANGGSGYMSSQGYTFDEPKALSNNTFTRTGYTFAGWAAAADGPAVYTDGQSVNNLAVTPGETVTLYALWNGIRYTVEYNRNGSNSVSMPSQSFTYGAAQDLRTNTYTRTGYTFAGWAVTIDGPVAYTDGQNVSNLTTTANARVTLVAKWSPITYTVAYHANNGDGTMADSALTYDAAQNLRPNTFTRLNYRFDGWATTANGAVAYTNGQSVSNLADTQGATVTLYAKWNNAYTVKYNGNGNSGSSTMADSSFTYGAAQNLPNNAFTRTGYTFMGWALTANGGVVYNNGQSVTDLVTTAEAAITLYAVWKANTYTVKYNKNSTEAAGTMEDSSFTYGVAQNLRTNQFTRTGGYVFMGWATAENTSTVAHTDGKLVTNLSPANGATVNLYAVWSNGYTVIFNANGGTGTISNKSFVVGVADYLLNSGFTRTGYHFIGWAKSPSATSATYGYSLPVSPGTTVGETITLYAVWEANKCTVVFDKNATKATGTTSSQSFTYGAAAKPLSSNGFSRTYYTFQGWATAANSTTVAYTNGQSVSNLSTEDGATITLYAVWKGWTFTLRYNANGGSGSMANQTFIYGTAQPLSVCAFTRDGYTFTGWAEDSTFAGRYSSGQSFNIEGSNVAISTGPSNTASCTLYATWRKNN